MTAVRVVHVPGRTPYARKLSSTSIRVLNATRCDGLDVPRDATLSWLLEQRPGISSMSCTFITWTSSPSIS